MKYLAIFFLFASLSAVAQHQLPFSASLNFSLPDTLQATQFYTEIIVSGNEAGFYGSTFSDGFIGLEQKGKLKKIVFKLWGETEKLKPMAIGLDVITKKPGNVYWNYNWQPHASYKFLITAIADSAGKSSFFTGYVYLPEVQQWKLLASFQHLNNGRNIKNPAVTIALHKRKKDLGNRKLSLQQSWVQRQNGSWKTLQQIKFSTNDVIGGVAIDNGKLFIAGKKITATSVNGQQIQSTESASLPVISVTNHIDSLNQFFIDQAIILDAISKNKIDTTGSNQNVYFKIIKEGNGNYVEPNDTITVYYKGSLLDGSVFDQTKEKPATFPLNRLIKAWPIGLQKTKTGGITRLIIPSGLAYGIRSRSKAIPPNSILIFDIEVLSAKKPAKL